MTGFPFSLGNNNGTFGSNTEYATLDTLFVLSPLSLDIQSAYQQMMERGLSARTVRYTHAVLSSAQARLSSISIARVNRLRLEAALFHPSQDLVFREADSRFDSHM